MRFSLLSENTKLAKSVKIYGDSVLTAGLSLAPHARSGIHGFNACPSATPGCVSVCNLWFSGRTVTEPVRAAMVRRTAELVNNPASFYARLERDLQRIHDRALLEGKTAYVRLNVASDLDWTPTIRNFGAIRFYDYTKVKTRADAMARGQLPANYWITPSYSERMDPRSLSAYLRNGLNVSVVFDTAYFPCVGRIDPLPDEWRGFPVIDGDTHDLRYQDYDGKGNIIGLRFKGSRKLMAQAIERGFVIATG